MSRKIKLRRQLEGRKSLSCSKLKMIFLLKNYEKWVSLLYKELIFSHQKRKEKNWRTEKSKSWAIKEKVIKISCPSCRMRGKKVSHYRGFRGRDDERVRGKIGLKEFKKKISWFAFFLMLDQWEKLNSIRKISLNGRGNMMPHIVSVMWVIFWKF